jgi:hypothetical protein
MGLDTIDPEVWKFIAGIIAALIGGGIVTYITLPGMLEKTRAEIRKTNIETAETALSVANEATKQAEAASSQVAELKAVLEGDLLISGRFSMSDIMKNGSAPLRGTVIKIKTEIIADP